jgi:hypothetical protein
VTDICVTLSDWKDQNLSIVILNIFAYKFYDFAKSVCARARACVCVCVDRVTVQKGDRSGRATSHVVITDSTASNLTRALECDAVILYS